MVSIGNGAKAQVEQQIASLGENVILIFSGSVTSSGIRTGWGSAGTLKIEDAEAIRREVPGVIAVSEEVISTSQVSAGNQNWFTRIYGESPEYFDIRQWPLSDGAIFTPQDVRSANKVCVIGRTTASQIFGSESPIGQVLRIKGVPFLITGVLTPKGLSPQGTDQDDIVIMPYTSAMKRVIGGTTLRGINVQVASPADLAPAQDQVTELLRQRHNIRTGRDDDFTVRNQQEIAETATATSRIMTLLLGAIASVSLVVGGIGIMNIMLVSVTERTREIGVRLAVGAHGRDILTQFLIEAVSLSPDRRRNWDSARARDLAGSLGRRALADVDLNSVDRCGVFCERGGRDFFWFLSGAAGRTARPDRGVALRVRGDAIPCLSSRSAAGRRGTSQLESTSPS